MAAGKKKSGKATPPRTRRKAHVRAAPDLKQQLAEARAQRAATAAILKIISRSPADTGPVFQGITRSAAKLCGAPIAAVILVDGDLLRLASIKVAPQAFGPFAKLWPMPIERGGVQGAVVRDRKLVNVGDVESDARIAKWAIPLYRELKIRSGLWVPMLRKGAAIGMIVTFHHEAAAFGPESEGLLQTFADQAVIAIENVRLFNETKESLERQTATAEILKVIASSPADVQPVFDAIVQSASRLFGRMATLRLVEADGLRRRALSDPAALQSQPPDLLPIDSDSLGARVVRGGKALQVVDTRAPDAPQFARAHGHKWSFRSNASAPLVRDGKVIGTVGVSSPEPGALSDKQMELLATFADQAVIAIENVRLFNETKESLERQTATADILKVISSSPTDLAPVFKEILGNATQLCDAQLGLLYSYDGEAYRLLDALGATSAYETFLRSAPIRPGPKTALGRVARERQPAHVHDVLADAAYIERDPLRMATAKLGGARTLLIVPMVKQEKLVGALAVYRREVRQFEGKQVTLLQTFADQAAIAIENVRLFNETREALERQTATAEILKVIASSPANVQPVFDAIVETAKRLVGAFSATVTHVGDGMLHLVAHTATTPQGAAALGKYFPIPVEGTPMGRAIQLRRPEFIADFETDPTVKPADRELARTRGFRSVVFVPLVRGDVAIGSLNVTRLEAGRVTDHQLELLKTFADQAVIAIENVRLFNETKEALERQTATAEILKVIASSPSDVQPVFDAIAASARRLLDGGAAVVARRAGDQLELAAYTSSGEVADAELRSLFPAKITGQGHAGRAVLTGTPIRVSDIQTENGYSEAFRAQARVRGVRSAVSVPMLREGTPIGVISINRPVAGNFSEHQTNLLRTFADQAVIAIENVRLFNETREALEQQTATAEILKVISESPTDTQPVFDAIVQAGLRLFPDSMVLLGIPQGGKVRAAAVASADAEVGRIMMSRFPIPFARGWMHAEAILDGEFINFSDAEQEKGGRYGEGVKNFLSSGYRAITIVPMMAGESAIGAISVSRPKPGPLSEKQVALLRTFAAQAVIAIENVRIFKELEARTGALSRSVDQLTALGEVGQSISSTLDLDTVLRTIVARAVQLTGMDGGTIYEYDERTEEFNLRAAENLSDEIVEMLRDTPMHKGEGAIGHAVETGEPTEIADMRDESYQSPRRDSLIQAGYRALLVVPLRREDHIIGALTVNRKAPGHFSHEVVGLLKTFATQSAMAIQNARLFREIAEKGQQLEVASRHKSDFLASMSHELRTPLNAILGFNEMILGQVYGDVPQDMREPLEDIQKSGKHLLRLINNVLDLAKIEAGRMELALMDYSVQDTVESVRSTLRPLAAEKGLEFLASVPADLPLAYGDGGRITQCLMNLAGNSLKFTKAGKVEISVAEKGSRLTFRVADTGIGIPPDKIAGLFTEFKQTDATIASEYGGTGLGLSISKKFVEMHGGRIWVESEFGKGSAFIFEIPLRMKTP